MNTVNITGRLGADPEVRFTGSGTAVAEIRLAVDNPRDRENPDWVSVIVWDKQAEALAQNNRKGMQLAVEGRLTTQSWEDNEGKKHSALKVTANRVQFLSPKANEGAANAHDQTASASR